MTGREGFEFSGITGFVAVTALCLGRGVGVFLLVLGLGLFVWSWL